MKKKNEKRIKGRNRTAKSEKAEDCSERREIIRTWEYWKRELLNKTR